MYITVDTTQKPNQKMEMQFFVRLLFCHALLFFQISYDYSNFHLVICLLVLVLHMGDAMQTTRLLQKLYIILCHRLYYVHSCKFFRIWAM